MSEIEKFEDLKKRKISKENLDDLNYDGYITIEVFTNSQGKLMLGVKSSYENLQDSDFKELMTAMLIRLREINTKPPR